jgi:hypothetical protein
MKSGLAGDPEPRVRRVSPIDSEHVGNTAACDRSGTGGLGTVDLTEPSDLRKLIWNMRRPPVECCP